MERWPIKPEYRAAIITKLMQVVANPETKPRELTAAAKALLAADKLNMESEAAERDRQQIERRAELSGIAEALGLESGVIEAIESGGVWVAGSAGEAPSDTGRREGYGSGAKADNAEQGRGDIHPGGQGPAAS